MKAIVGGTVYTPSEVFDPGTVLIEGETIEFVGGADVVRIPPSAERIDATGLRVVPGYLDVHIHGLLGHDAMGPGLADMIRDLPRYGVTSFMATTLTLPRQEILDSLQAMAAVLEEPPTGARCLGIHLEGPHLSPARTGMATAEWFSPLTWEDYESLQQAARGRIRMITFAPEIGDSLNLIPRLIQAGVIPVIGHSDATFEVVARAVELGLAHATHTYNAMRGLHHREPGVLGAVMYFDQIMAELIADGIHVHPAAIAILLRVKGLERVVLISDAAPMAGLPDGQYEWEHKPVYVKDGACRLADGTIAGAHALLDQGIRVLCRGVGLPLEKALVPATQSAAASVGATHPGRLAPGAAADLVLLDADLRPARTFVAGHEVWRAENTT
ncbi:MAG: N-acetylglucosamine-6-phosphate deacetylase [Chloroflexota bacterium]